MPLDDAIQAGVGCFTSAYDSDEPRRRMQAFLDRKSSPQRNREG
jgi:hypothetical protein